MKPMTEDQLTEDQVRGRAFEHQLNVLRSRHETLGAAYRDACEELERLRKEAEGLRARLTAVRVLCEVTVP